MRRWDVVIVIEGCHVPLWRSVDDTDRQGWQSIILELVACTATGAGTNAAFSRGPLTVWKDRLTICKLMVQVNVVEGVAALCVATEVAIIKRLLFIDTVR